MSLALFIGIAGFFGLLFFTEYFFGRKHVDDRQGFPWSRNRRKGK
jgi:hypothetical protein